MKRVEASIPVAAPVVEKEEGEGVSNQDLEDILKRLDKHGNDCVVWVWLDKEILSVNNEMLEVKDKVGKHDDEIVRLWEEIESLKKNSN